MEAIVVKAVARELGRELPARVHAVLQPSPRVIVVVLRGAAERRLLLSTEPVDPRLHWLSARPVQQAVPTAFCRLLRKRLEGRVVTAVDSPGVERIVRFELVAPRGGQPDLRLVAEMMGKHSNLVLVEASTGLIIDSLQHVDAPMSRVRTVLPGWPYTPPPETGRLPLDSIEAPAFAALWGQTGGSPDELLRRVLGIGPGLFVLALGRARQQPGFGTDPGGTVLAEMRTCFERVARGEYRPVFYPDRGVLLPDPVPGWESEPHQVAPSMNAAAEQFYERRIGERETAARRQERARELRRELKKTVAEEAMRREELRDAQDVPLYQAAGTALNIAADGVPKGTGVFAVADPRTGAVRVIPLDPRLGPRQNAEALFRRARKLRVREALAAQKLPTVEARRRQLEEELALVPTLAPEAFAGSEARDAQRRPGSTAAAAALSGIREYRSPEGWRILVGKSGAGNERLTGRIAAPEDYWFHARDYPGAHVVLKGAGARPPEEAILAAAAVAAWHSGARTERLVDVAYTRRKNVRKARGGPPGKVLLAESSTIRVRPAVPGSGQEDPT